jgi:alkaline phosphatase
MFPYMTFARTNSYSGVTDSAAGGTALATGYKTCNKYVGLDKNGNELKSLTELAGELGKATAVMSTETQTGATPSSFSAHELSRNDSGDIREDQLQLIEKYGTVIECNFNHYTSKLMKTSVEKRISDTLAKLDADEDGFFMMYEEAHIDKYSHKQDMEGTFKALVRFNQAIARFMEYAFYNPDTVVIITADHETGGLLPDNNGGVAYTVSDAHTGVDVPVFAYGYGTEAFGDNTIIENIEIAKFFASRMGVNNFGDQSNDWYDEIYGGQN